ncbi:MAG TPA: hypothetical protein PK803_01560 [Alphaproteobacteria bacterium]|nr:hypothetical protein [Alphaproteobacteria bacterium]
MIHRYLKLLLLDNNFYRFLNPLFASLLTIWLLPSLSFAQNSSFRWVEDEEELKSIFQERTIIGQYSQDPTRQWIEYYQADGGSTYFWDDCYHQGIWWIRSENPKACFSYFDNVEIGSLRTNCFNIGLGDNNQIIFAVRSLSSDADTQVVTFSLKVENGNSRQLPTGADMEGNIVCNKPISWFK